MAAVETSAGRGRGPQRQRLGNASHVIGMVAKSCSSWCPGVSFYRDVEKDGKLLGKSIYTWIQTVGIFHIYVSLEEGKYW